MAARKVLITCVADGISVLDSAHPELKPQVPRSRNALILPTLVAHVTVFSIGYCVICDFSSTLFFTPHLNSLRSFLLYVMMI